MLESLVALAVIALAIGSMLAGIAWTLGKLSSRTERVWLTELARSIGDEYRVTRDPALFEGTFAEMMEWSVTTAPPPATVTGGANLIEVTVTAWPRGRREDATTLTYLMPGNAP